ncbi:hypothetical protein SteCoe_523 [Stentor coeruleus]|uniref:GRIP domain-containing protein n=1 Tax=Stentor coeruleus TaxID=5963 RepID=A0A1R2D425_9CILI|nr:hypothetical protein SteCoe_523 [Stentor coeruleus]
MGDTQNDLPSTNPSEDDETQLEKVQKRNERLQQLLIKAKDTIKQYSSQVNTLESNIYEREIKQNELQTCINRLLKYEPPHSDTITEVICRVKVQENIFCYIKSNKGNFWIPESTFKYKMPMPDIIDSSFTAKVINDQILSITQEWKEKYKEISSNLSMQIEKNTYIQDLVKDQQNKIETLEKENKKIKESGVISFVIASTEIYDMILDSVMDDILDNDKFTDIQKALNRYMNIIAEDERIRVRDHCGILLRSLFETSKRLLYARNELKSQDDAWRNTCDALVIEKEELKQQIMRVKNEMVNKVDGCMEEIRKIREERSKEIVRYEEKIRKLEEDIDKRINQPYLKHVLLQFICSKDFQVQERLLNVISTILNFSQEEMLKIKETRAPKSMLNKFINWQ